MQNLCTLNVLVEKLSRPIVLVGYRLIADDDEQFLLPEEAPYFRNAVPKVQRQSAAARIVARNLLGQLGLKNIPIVRASQSRAPVWPDRVVGSLAHTEDVAVAVVARSTHMKALGIDIEPAAPLPSDIVNRVSTPTERLRYGEDILNNRYLFVAKEVAYKAAYPLDGFFLDFQDIEVDLENSVAHLRYGRTITLEIVAGCHIIALAHVCA